MSILGGTLISGGYVYSFCYIFQGVRLLRGLRLFQTLEYIASRFKTPPIRALALSIALVYS